MGTKRKLSPHQENEICRLFQEGVTIVALQAKYRIGGQLVRRTLDRHGVDRPGRRINIHNGAVPYLSPEEIKKRAKAVKRQSIREKMRRSTDEEEETQSFEG